jgi:hypothetical protein
MQKIIICRLQELYSVQENGWLKSNELIILNNFVNDKYESKRELL